MKNELVTGSDADIEPLEQFENYVGATGWSVGGKYIPGGEVNVDFYRKENSFTFDPKTTAERLGLTDDKGNIIPGYKVDKDEETGQLVIGYDGTDDERFRDFAETLLDHGRELTEIQTAFINLREIARKIGPEAVTLTLYSINDAETLADPRLQASIAAMKKGDLVQIAPQDSRTEGE